MKRLALILTLIFIFSSVIHAQEVIENPERPLSKNAGRTVELEEVLRIQDDGKNIIFRGPHDLQVGDDGNIYFFDLQLYKYDDKGEFVFRIIKEGEGPGEAQKGLRKMFLVSEDEIIVQAQSPPKVMRFDLQGKFKGEKKTRITTIVRLAGLIQNKIYGFLFEVSHEKLGKEGYVEFPEILYEFTPDFQNQIKVYEFPMKFYVIRRAWFGRSYFNYALKGQDTLYVSRTSEYRIDEFNIEKGKIIKVFKRDYKRVKIPPEKRRKRRPGFLYAPPLEYYHDIWNILVYKDRLWVVTSTQDKQGNRLIDVFDQKGEYIDSFYLQFPEGWKPRGFFRQYITAKRDCIYTVDENSEGFCSIAKYKIVN